MSKKFHPDARYGISLNAVGATCPEIFLSDNDLARRYGISRNAVWRWHRERSDFPRAIKLTPGCTRWRLSEIEAWEQAKVEVA